MASTLKINTLTGVSTAGSIAVTGEGNSTTTNLQQGLCKAWNFISDADAGTIVQGDSFNTSSALDNGTGLFRFPLTNAMGNTNYLHIGNPSGATDNYTAVALRDLAQQNSLDGRTTASFAIRIRNQNNSDDDVAEVGMGLIGDLA
jgi:hypothetical protein